MLKVVEDMPWPKSMRVFVRPKGGERFLESLYRLEGIVEGCDPEMVILHSGINDVSKLEEIAVDHVIKSFKLNARKIARKSKGICAVSG